MQLLSREVHGKIDDYEVSKAKKHVAVLRNDHILAFGEVFVTSLTSSNSFNVRFAILTLLTLCCTWPTVSKTCAMPTNSNAHVPIQRLLRCVHEAYTTTTYTYIVVHSCIYMSQV